jgi:type VI secretion system protein ImpG
MSAGDRLYDEFLGELAALDGFLLQRNDDPSDVRGPTEKGRRNAGPDARPQVLPLSRHDPDVRRLLEGMAYLSARTRMLAVQGIRQAVDRLNQGYFDFLLTATPAAGLIQIVPTSKLDKPVVLERGTAIRLETPEGAVGLFSTTRKLTVLPLAISSCRSSNRGRRWALQIDLKSSLPEGALDNPLSLRVNDVGDYLRSRKLLASLAHVRVSVAFDPRPNEDPSGARCEHYFGSPRDAEVPEDDARSPPLARIRSFFHFPAQDLFLNVRLPPLPKVWKCAVIYLDFDENWSVDVPLNDDTFQLFEVPVVNLRNDFAKPIVCDGTREAYLIEGVNPAALGGIDELPGEAAELHSITGVYRKTTRGAVPIASALLSDHGDTYEVEEEGDDPDHLQRRLLLRIEDAFEDPAHIQVQGLWYQPGFDAVAHTRLKVSLQRRSIAGIELRLADDLEPHRPSPLWNEPRKLLHLLSLRTTTNLSREEVLSLLALLGADRQSYHAAAVELVADIIASEVAGEGPRGDGVRYLYEIVLRPYAPTLQGLVDDLVQQVHALLDAWLPGAVQVTARPTSTLKRLPAGRSGS